MIQYDNTASLRLLTPRSPDSLHDRLLRVREEVLGDLDVYNSSRKAPVHKLPLDAGFIEYPARLLNGETETDLGRLEGIASELREQVDAVVSLGIGGSYMGALALFEALCHTWHNELPRERRCARTDGKPVPRIYFEGHNVDNDSQRQLLDLLQSRSSPDVDGQWAIVVISKSGATTETAAAFRVFCDALERSGGKPADRVFPITGQSGLLRDQSLGLGIPEGRILPVPDGIGGRFSILTPVGLLPAAVMGLNVRELLAGAADMTRRFFEAPPGENPVLDYVATCHLFERDHGMPLRVLSTWGSRLESVGLWYDQLLAESLGKYERGPTPLTVVNTRDLHSRGQQHQEGARDRLITNLRVVPSRSSDETVCVPPVAAEFDPDNLNDRPIDEIQAAAFAGTNKAYADDDRPTADITLSALDESSLGEFFQMMMLATLVEGRLININPYGQPGVEAYKGNMRAILRANAGE